MNKAYIHSFHYSRVWVSLIMKSNMTKMLISIFLLVCLIIPIKIYSQVNLVSEKCLTNSPYDDHYASYSHTGERIVFESNRDGNWEIYLMDSTGMNQKRLTFNDSDDRRPTWHPSGEKILFESSRSGKNELYLKDLKSLKVKKISNFVKKEPIFGCFSPDGKIIAVSLKESEDISNIVLIDNTGKIIKELTSENKRSYFPKWSNDGKDIVYFSRKETNNEDDEIYKLNIESGIEKRLTNWPKHNFCPSWSNDNSRIVYVTSMEGIRPEIYIMDSDGNNQVRITHNKDGETLPDWSPNGNKILITAYRNGNFEICELELHFN